MKKNKHDHPFDQVVDGAIEKMKDGMTVFQKFTCSKCGQRLTMDVPNKFFVEGTCDKCGTITDIRKQGCNYMAMYSSDPTKATPAQIVAAAVDKKRH